jgi:hypothetical protein
MEIVAILYAAYSGGLAGVVSGAWLLGNSSLLAGILVTVVGGAMVIGAVIATRKAKRNFALVRQNNP